MRMHLYAKSRMFAYSDAMKTLTISVVLLCVFITVSITGCFDMDYSDSSTKKNADSIFETIDYNLSTDREYFRLEGNYEVVTPDPALFKKYVDGGTITLEIMNKSLELELKEVIFPEGARKVSLNNGQNLYFDELDPQEVFIFEGTVVNNMESSAWFTGSESMGYIDGEIVNGNEEYNIRSTEKVYNGKPVEIIYVSQYQRGMLNLSVVPEKTKVKDNETFDIHLTLTNTGNNTLNVWKLYEQISYDIYFKSVESNNYADYSCGVLSRVPMTNDNTEELKPRESINATFNSRCWELEPGEYTLYGVYRTLKNEMVSKPYWFGEIKSEENEILVEH